MPQQTEQTTVISNDRILKTFTDSFKSNLVPVRILRKKRLVWEEKVKK